MIAVHGESNMSDMYLLHSAKGSEWKKHKYKGKHTSDAGNVIYEYADAKAQEAVWEENYYDAKAGSIKESIAKGIYDVAKKRSAKAQSKLYGLALSNYEPTNSDAFKAYAKIGAKYVQQKMRGNTAYTDEIEYQMEPPATAIGRRVQ